MKEIKQHLFPYLSRSQKDFVRKLEKDLRKKGYVFAVSGVTEEGELAISYFHKEDPAQELKWLTIGREAQLTEGFNAE